MLDLPDIDLVGDVSTVDEGHTLLSETLPDVALADARHCRRLVERSSVWAPAHQRPARLVAVSDGKQPETDLWLALTGTVSQLRWSDLTAISLPLLLDVVTRSDILFISPDTATAVTRAVRRTMDGAGAATTAREGAILELLAAGLSQGEVACRLRVSRRTVTRAIESLQHRWGAHSQFALGQVYERQRIFR